MAVAKNLEDLIGKAPDQLDLPTREAVVGSYVAMQIYTPRNLALQRIAAAGGSVRDCVAQLVARGLDPLDYEFSQLNWPFLAR